MLIHDLYINVAIVVILLFKKSIYNLQETKYKDPMFAPKGDNWAWPSDFCAAGNDHPPYSFWAGSALATVINSKRCMTSECNTIIRA